MRRTEEVREALRIAKCAYNDKQVEVHILQSEIKDLEKEKRSKGKKCDACRSDELLLKEKVDALRKELTASYDYWRLTPRMIQAFQWDEDTEGAAFHDWIMDAAQRGDIKYSGGLRIRNRLVEPGDYVVSVDGQIGVISEKIFRCLFGKVGEEE